VSEASVRILLYNSKLPNNNFHLAASLSRAFGEIPGVQCRIAHPTTLRLWLRALRPHALIAVGGEEIDCTDSKALRSLKQESNAKWMLWTTEDPFELELTPVIAPLFDTVVTTDAGSLKAYRKHPSHHHLPLAADRVFHYYPARAAGEEFLYDLMFVGTAWPNRIPFLADLKDALQSRGFRGRFLVPSNPHVPQDDIDRLGLAFERNVRISPRDVAALQNRSRFALSMFRDFTRHDTKPRPQSSPTNRFYETGLTGTGQIIAGAAFDVARFHPEIAGHIAQCSTVDEVIGIVERDRTHPEMRDRDALAVQEFVERQHLYIHRARHLLQILGLRADPLP
jgi:hypothetical protein